MDFQKKELKMLLQALYHYRGKVSGATQSERHKLETVQGIISKIEEDIGPLTPELTPFDKQMEEALSILKKGKVSNKKRKTKS
jgi:hypothetical protein